MRATTAAEAGGARPVLPEAAACVNGQAAATAAALEEEEKRGWWIAMATARPTATGGPLHKVNAKTAKRASHPALGG
jgi:hypothetical protein